LAAVKRVGVVYHGGAYEVIIEGLREGLRASGLEEGRHIALLLHNSQGDEVAAEAVARVLERDDKVDVIVGMGTSAALAAKRATTEVPIVFAAGTDPVAAGLVESIAKPGGRVTGVHFFTVDLTAKRLEILREIMPKLRRVVTFHNPGSRPAVSALKVARQAASKLGIDVAAHPVTSAQEIRDRLRTLSTADTDAYFFVSDFLVIGYAQLVIEASNATRLPTMATDVSLVRTGALAGYGPDFREIGRRVASYVVRVLAGSPPRDLPVEAIDQPALAINLKTARAIGLDIPPLLLTRADEVIE
jgi:putative tryptophan/tyrosine transport system substrate-binding protein